MLVHIGQIEVAENLQNAWLRTMEDGVHTYDIFVEGKSSQKVGTKEFAEAARLGQKPQTFCTDAMTVNLRNYDAKAGFTLAQGQGQ